MASSASSIAVAPTIPADQDQPATDRASRSTGRPGEPDVKGSGACRSPPGAISDYQRAQWAPDSWHE